MQKSNLKPHMSNASPIRKVNDLSKILWAQDINWSDEWTLMSLFTENLKYFFTDKCMQVCWEPDQHYRKLYGSYRCLWRRLDNHMGRNKFGRKPNIVAFRDICECI